MPRMQPSARQGSPNNATNTAGAGDAFIRRFALDEDLPTCGCWTPLLKIISDGLTDITEKWQSGHASALAMNLQFSGVPIDIVQTEACRLASAQTQSGQQKQDRVIPFYAAGRTTVEPSRLLAPPGSVVVPITANQPPWGLPPRASLQCDRHRKENSGNSSARSS